jgi:gephyrin
MVEIHAQRLPPVKLQVNASLIGAVLAEDIVAEEAVPGYPASIVDGYAVICTFWNLSAAVQYRLSL